MSFKAFEEFMVGCLFQNQKLQSFTIIIYKVSKTYMSIPHLYAILDIWPYITNYSTTQWILNGNVEHCGR